MNMRERREWRRDIEIYVAHMAGENQQTIGEWYDISQVRVSQILTEQKQRGAQSLEDDWNRAIAEEQNSSLGSR